MSWISSIQLETPEIEILSVALLSQAKKSECGITQLSPYMYTAQLHQWQVHVHVYCTKFVSTNESRAWFVRTNPIEVPWRKRRNLNVALCQRPTSSGPLEKRGKKDVILFWPNLPPTPPPVIMMTSFIYRNLENVWDWGPLYLDLFFMNLNTPLSSTIKVLSFDVAPPPLKW